ncbi:MAG: prolyl oligopeptidase family serine peptidase [Pseudomonadota bacterium]
MCLFVQACVAYEPGPVSADLSGGGDGRIWFQSVDVYDFPDFANGPPVRVIHGDLTLPEGPVRGAVILSHGSGGPSALHRRYARWLEDQGLATFLIDHFGPRNVGSTVRDQIRITEQGMMADVIAAQRLLASHPALDPSRIGHIGWSKGASTGLLASVDRFSALAGRDAPLAFVAGFYPFCGVDMSGERLSSPLLVMIGDNDDWTLPRTCVAAVAALNASETDARAEIVVYPGARHGFDGTASDRTISGAVTVRDDSPRCLLKATADGAMQTLDGQRNVSSRDARIAYLRACGVRGVQYGGNADARGASEVRLKVFIDRHLP